MNEFRIALKLDPDNLDARQNYADVLRDRENYKEAAAQYGELVKRDPKNIEALIGLGLSSSETGGQSEAVSALLKALEIDPNDPRPHYYLGMALERSGDKDAAAEQFETCVSLSDDRKLIKAARKRIKKLR
jgi:cytochrome c-type biogenesis protein CcmH/NrfG